MVFTNWIDLTFKILSFIFFVVLVVSLGMKFPRVEAWFSRSHRILKTVAYCLAGAIYYFGFHHPVVDVLSAQLYTREYFEVTPTWSQARELRRLFGTTIGDSKWYPMEGVRLLPREERLTVLLQEARMISLKHGGY